LEKNGIGPPQEAWETGMKWLKKWFYLLMLIGTGTIYLTCVDKWQVYAEPLAKIKGWYRDLGLEDAFAQGNPLPGLGVSESTAQDPGTGSAESGETQGSFGADPEGSVGEGSVPESGPEGDPEGSAPEGEPEGSAPEGGPEGSAPEGSVGEGSVPESGPEGNGGEESTPVTEAGEGENGSETNPSGTEGNPGQEAPDAGAADVQYMTVEDDYFSDAVFIGDSRTVGMFEYGGLEETAAFYASTGLTVYKMFDSEIVPVPGEKKKITVEEALQANSFKKIYLMIGINEMGTGTVESFIEKYREVVAHLQELQPDAIIYLQGIIKVTEERSAQGDYINNEGIVARNEGIAGIADNEKIFYLDVNPLVCDESGGMIPDYTFDGVHLKARYIGIWKDYLKTHAISS